jgi:hypothetical protein
VNLSLRKFLIPFYFISVLFISNSVVAQDEKIGQQNIFGNTTGGYYNYADPDGVNIEVNVWGFAKFTGKFLIPQGTTLQDLVSYAGGPTIDAKVEEIRLLRPKNDSLGITRDQIITFNYDDLFWQDKVGSSMNKPNPVLLPGDILIFPGEPRLFFKDELTLWLAVGSTLISLAILVLNITNKNN